MFRAARSGGVRLVTGFSRSSRYHLLCDLRLGLRDNFARVFRRVFLETRTNRVSPIMRVREIGSSCHRSPSLPSLRSLVWSECGNSWITAALPFRSAAVKTRRNYSSESCKQASILGYTLPAVAQSWTGRGSWQSLLSWNVLRHNTWFCKPIFSVFLFYHI